jgi:hypothetical protein
VSVTQTTVEVSEPAAQPSQTAVEQVGATPPTTVSVTETTVTQVSSTPASNAGPAIVAATGDLTEEAVRSSWSQVMNIIRTRNASLGLMMGVANLLSITGRTVNLGVRFKFHKDRIKATKNEELIRAAMEEAWGKPVMMDVQIGEEFAATAAAQAGNISEPSPEEVKNVWDLALNVFGDEKKG